MSDEQVMRDESMCLSDSELIDELARPTGNWKEDVTRESLRRILQKLISIKENTGGKE